MSIRPVDMQVLIPKATEVGKTHSAASEHALTAQQSFKNEIDKHYENLTTTVTDTNKSEHLVDKDGSNREKNRRERQKRRKEVEKKELEKKDLDKKNKYQRGMFDIQI